MFKTLRLLLFLPLFSTAQKSGISFQQATWNQLLAKAKSEKKIIFLDAYATWCGPCKKMTADVFSTEEVGNFYNRNFINAKIDMESGEGPSLANKYDVQAYPTLLYINGDGELLHKSIGYLSTEEFIATGRDALDPGKQFYTLSRAYYKGTLTDAQHYQLALTALKIEDPSAEKIASAYLNKKTNWLTESCINLLLKLASDPSDPYYSYLSKNEKSVNEIAGEERATDALNTVAFRAIEADIPETEPTRSAVKKLETGLKKYRPASAARRFTLAYGMYLSEEREETTLSKEYLVLFLNEYGDELTWDVLNQHAWDYFEKETDKELLRSALGWALKSVSKDSNFYNNDTVAQLHFKLGNKKEAIRYAETALRLGKEAGEDVTETENLLKKLK
jgi:thiol-disulfide isomerase/thioredoxin